MKRGIFCRATGVNRRRESRRSWRHRCLIRTNFMTRRRAASPSLLYFRQIRDRSQRMPEANRAPFAGVPVFRWCAHLALNEKPTVGHSYSDSVHSRQVLPFVLVLLAACLRSLTLVSLFSSIISVAALLLLSLFSPIIWGQIPNRKGGRRRSR